MRVEGGGKRVKKIKRQRNGSLVFSLEFCYNKSNDPILAEREKFEI